MVFASGEVKLTNLSQWVFETVGCWLVPLGYFFAVRPTGAGSLTYGYSRSVLEPKIANGLHHRSVLMLIFQKK